MSAPAPSVSPFQPAAGVVQLQDSSSSSDTDQADGLRSQQAAALEQANGGPDQEAVGLPPFQVGWAQSHGNRPHQDDRCVEFVLQLPTGGAALVWAVADGHHQHHVAQLVCDELQEVLTDAVERHVSLEQALRAAIRRLDDVVFARHSKGLLTTGGTTLIVHVLTPTHVYTANVGDCKSILSSRGAVVELNTCHNPNVPSERGRFEALGIYCSADHIGGSDINVCRTLGDYDLGTLKGRDKEGRQTGPLISEPEVGVVALDDTSEFVITASDGLWDYYSPDSSVLTNTRRTMRQMDEDPQQVAEWLLEQALARQQQTLHPGTPGDNVTIMVIKLRPLLPLPRTTGSRLCLVRGSSGDLTSPKMLSELPEASACSSEAGAASRPGTNGASHQQLRRVSPLLQAVQPAQQQQQQQQHSDSQRPSADLQQPQGSQDEGQQPHSNGSSTK